MTWWSPAACRGRTACVHFPSAVSTRVLGHLPLTLSRLLNYSAMFVGMQFMSPVHAAGVCAGWARKQGGRRTAPGCLARGRAVLDCASSYPLDQLLGRGLASTLGKPMKLSEFDYVLPKALIAQHPLAERDASRLLLLDRASCGWEDRS